MAFVSGMPLPVRSKTASSVCRRRVVPRMAKPPQPARTSEAPSDEAANKATAVEEVTKPAKDAPVVEEEDEAPERLSNIQIFAERLSDTMYDAALHYGRIIGTQRKNVSSDSVGAGRVVVLGSGWGAHSLVKVTDMTTVTSLTCISPRNFFFFTPLLCATAVGSVEYRSIVEPMRTCQPEADFFEAFATDIDPERQVVHCTSGKRDANIKDAHVQLQGVEEFSDFCHNFAHVRIPIPVGRVIRGPIRYSTCALAYTSEEFRGAALLVVAVGETTSTFGVPGARKHAYMLKEIDDAIRMRKKLLDCLEKAKLPTKTDEERRDLLNFVIVGGGPTGCEFAGELSDLLQDLKPKYGEEFASLIQVTLLQSGDSLLTQFEESIQNSAVESFVSRINVVFGARVVEVTDKEVILKDGRSLKYGMLVWAAGNGTRPIIGRLLERITDGEVTESEAIAKRRKLPVDPWLRVKGAKNIFALGDCSLMEGEALPATAQVAGQQGAFIARLLSRGRRLSGPGAPLLRDTNRRVKMHRFNFLSAGLMASIGNNQAVVQVEAVEAAKVSVGGFVGWLLWLSAYATKQVNTRSRILVLFDVVKARLWGRDLSQF